MEDYGGSFRNNLRPLRTIKNLAIMDVLDEYCFEDFLRFLDD